MGKSKKTGVARYLVISPLARKLHGSLDRFGTSVHGEDHFKVQEVGDVLGEDGEDVVVEGTRGQGAAARLLGESLDDGGMAMT